MNRYKIQPGMEVIIKTVNLRTGLLVSSEFIDNRKEGCTGKVLKKLKNHYDSAWWIKHEHGTAPYWYHEFELDINQTPEEEPEFLY